MDMEEDGVVKSRPQRTMPISRQFTCRLPSEMFNFVIFRMDAGGVGRGTPN